jgi:hypothetical protein
VDKIKTKKNQSKAHSIKVDSNKITAYNSIPNKTKKLGYASNSIKDESKTNK